ncbi:MAG TPA: hypothetical protein VIS06_19535 [Mycobacteriales bacterium]
MMLGPMSGLSGGMAGRRMMALRGGAEGVRGVTESALGGGTRTARAVGGLMRVSHPAGNGSTGAEARRRARDVVAAARGERPRTDWLRTLTVMGVGMGIGVGVGMAARACRHAAGSSGQMSEQMSEQMAIQMSEQMSEKSTGPMPGQMSGQMSGPRSGRVGGGMPRDPDGGTGNPPNRQ